MFDWIARWFAYRQDGNLVHYLLAPDNFHRIVWSFALLDLDARLVGASGYLFPLAGAIGRAVTALLLGREAARAAPGLGLVGAGFAAMLTLMSAATLDAAIAINGDYVYCLAFAALSIVLASGPTATPGLSRALAALLAAMASAFGIGVGLALWPVLLFGALRARADWRWTAAITVVGAIFGGLYLHGQAPPAGSGGPILAAGELFLSFLGLPWTRAVPAGGLLLGLVLTLGGVAGLARRGGPGAPRAERTACALILFSLLAALMAAVGRTGITDPLAPPLRYAVFVTPLHVGLLILALPWLARRRAARPGAFDLAVAAVGVLALGQLAVMGHAAVRTTDVNRQLIADFRAGQTTPAMTATVHPDLAHARALSDRLRREGLYQRELHLAPQPGAGR